MPPTPELPQMHIDDQEPTFGEWEMSQTEHVSQGQDLMESPKPAPSAEGMSSTGLAHPP